MEQPFEIGIIGGTGGIGKWFAEFFRGEGYVTHVTGRTTGMGLPELARRCSVIFVSVPIAVTVDVIRDIGPLMGRGDLLADFTSLKAEPLRAMLGHSRCEVVGTHPLFGPDVHSLSGQNVILCPGRGRKWIGWLRRTFKKGGAVITETGPEEHDRKMAAVQVLSHLGTIAMGLVLKGLGERTGDLEKFSTPVFRERFRTIEKVFGHPELYTELIRRNPASPHVLSLYQQELSRAAAFLYSESPQRLEKEMGAALKTLKKRPQKKI